MASVLLHDRVEQPFLLHTVIVGACFYRHHRGIRKCRAWPAGLLSRALIGSGGGDGGGVVGWWWWEVEGGGGAGRMQSVCACRTAGTAECLFYYFPVANYGRWT